MNKIKILCFVYLWGVLVGLLCAIILKLTLCEALVMWAILLFCLIVFNSINFVLGGKNEQKKS